MRVLWSEELAGRTVRPGLPLSKQLMTERSPGKACLSPSLGGANGQQAKAGLLSPKEAEGHLSFLLFATATCLPKNPMLPTPAVPWRPLGLCSRRPLCVLLLPAFLPGLVDSKFMLRVSSPSWKATCRQPSALLGPLVAFPSAQTPLPASPSPGHHHRGSATLMAPQIPVPTVRGHSAKC